jgi:DNA-directed RNA polymerase II subunit RPB1
MWHIGFKGVCLKVLRSVCYHCSILKIDARNVRFQHALRIKNGEKRLKAVYDLARGKSVCEYGDDKEVGAMREDGMPADDENAEITGHGGCGGLQPEYQFEGLKCIVTYPEAMEEIPGDRKTFFSAEKCYEIFKKIPHKDIVSMGLNPHWAHPAWLLITVMPVPPLHVRPAVTLDAISKGEDDLTHKLADIVKANAALLNSKRKGDGEHLVQQFEELLQYHLATYIDNEMPNVQQAQQRGGKPLKTIRQRLRGKEGRIRGNLMGKRVDFSARTVITADPNLGIEQVGVPRSVAKNLTYPERVTHYNIDRLRKLVENGPENHPGAKYIIRDDGNRVDLRFVQSDAVALQPGWVVERQLADGDYICFNRQPSLHKMSIMGHRVKVLDFSTFRLNLSCTSPYNADFDGDEMNLHVPQSELARAEVAQLMMSARVLVSGQSNKPVMGVVQDSLLGVYKMTKRDVLLDKKLFMNLIMWLDNWDGNIMTPAILIPNKQKPGTYTPFWTGKQVFNLFCPKLNLSATGSTHPAKEGFEQMSPLDSRVEIIDGELMMGIVDKKTVGSGGGGLVHTAYLVGGPNYSRVFLNQIQRIVNNWLVTHSFTVGVCDTVADPASMRTIVEILEEAKKQVRDLVQLGQHGRIFKQPGRTMIETFEGRVNTVLNAARDNAGKKAQGSISEANNVKETVTSGSKGSFINISQIIACVGQQNVEGARCPYGFKDRTLPHFSKDDLSPESRGFVTNSYLKGLTPQEFFFHAMGGREGLIDTAVKTAETGYIQRRLVKSMEDIMVKYDGTIRNSLGEVKP